MFIFKLAKRRSENIILWLFTLFIAMAFWTSTKRLWKCAANYIVSPSLFLFVATREHFKRYEQPTTVAALRESLYSDDFISSSCKVEEALSVCTTADEILSHTSRYLCMWVTNSPELRAKWRETLKRDVHLWKCTEVKSWVRCGDLKGLILFWFKATVGHGDRKNTKWGVLQGDVNQLGWEV